MEKFEADTPRARGSFDTGPYMISLKGKSYLPVAARVAWFRTEHPDWGIVTEPLIPLENTLPDNYAIFKCSIFNAEGKLIQTACKQETARDFADYIEKAETGSIGRALSLCGFGTIEAIEDLDEGTERGEVVESPVQRNALHARANNQGNTYPRGTNPAYNPKTGRPEGSYGVSGLPPTSQKGPGGARPVQAARGTSPGHLNRFNEASSKGGSHVRTTPEPQEEAIGEEFLETLDRTDTEVFHADTEAEAREYEKNQDLASAAFRRILKEYGVTVDNDESEKRAVNKLLGREGMSAEYRPSPSEYQSATSVFMDRMRQKKNGNGGQ